MLIQAPRNFTRHTALQCVSREKSCRLALSLSSRSIPSAALLCLGYTFNDDVQSVFLFVLQMSLWFFVLFVEK